MRLFGSHQRDPVLGVELRELDAAGPWFNVGPGPGPRLERLHGGVILLQFWTYVCGNCTRTIPMLSGLHEQYPRTDLQIVSIHTPELAVDRRPRNVAAAIATLGVRYPVGLDNDFELWNAWGVQAWPTLFLIDRDGRLRRRHVGEGGAGSVRAAVAALVREPTSPIRHPTQKVTR